MKQGCPPLESFAQVLLLHPGDPRRAHLEDCPRCSARRIALQSFLTMEPLPEGIDLDEARKRLSLAVRRQAAEAEFAGRRKPATLRGLLLLPRWKPALGLAAALVLGTILIRSTLDRRTDSEILLRGDGATEQALVLLPPVAGSDGSIVLSWRKAPGAETYLVMIYGPDLAEIARFETGSDTTLALPPARLSGLGPRGTVIFWRVATLQHGDQVSLSAPGTLRLR